MNCDLKNVKPFLKWAGGKRWFIDSYSSLLPRTYKRYIEPFLGSGAVFFYLAPEASVLGDKNRSLINTYMSLKKEPEKVLKWLRIHEENHSSDYYYKIRSSKLSNSPAGAANFIYLNRTCWNGLYRVNKRGEFNVPIGDRDSIIRVDDNFQAISTILKNAELHTGCFSEILSNSRRGDFCFIDPPYTVKHNNNGFIKYNETLFSWDEQVLLRDMIVDAKKRGVKILVLNANHESIRNLYDGVGEIIPLIRRSTLAAKSDKRGITTELAIKIGYSR